MFEGTLKKMLTETSSPINYFLDMKRGFVNLNQCINRKLSVTHIGSQCLNCLREYPIFRYGFCKSCFFESPAMGDWIIRPELSKAHLEKTDRDLEYEKKIQLQPHVIYLALSSHIKVGVTRKSQLPTRWIDQGAHQAIEILNVPNRYLAGIGEVTLKKIFSDKTNWRKMVQNEFKPVEWDAAIQKALDYLPNDLKQYIERNQKKVQNFEFPVISYPEKAKSLNLSKNPFYEGKLIGVKAQYLLFEDQTVFNIRSNEGQKVRLRFF